ncbi:alpha-amylase family glycosyl hydrolase [Paenibacillus sp. HWE-109]|uniref:alpha-amylase family glycosyl hydrolase n=1 Tax=Paenibacillus sp. HWE-109 TaxID=1306526 RepID=UPI001EDC9DCD|nr:alpha-amylase family glycosyl hydrolase [Paenibacillus sp. HWE-109]UKS25667.1 alpha-amylase family glycosyl hydrolase [Paenibacillus sp. HWE-109]
MYNDFPKKGEQGVRFLYFSEDPTVSCVSVAGTFNCWNHDRNYMTKTGENEWELELSLPKGRHLYKIVVNDEQWILDPRNSNISEDEQNNSSITVTEDGEVLIRTTDISEDNPGYLYENLRAIESPDWIKKAVIYELHIRAFTENGFRGLTDKLTYFKKLGINVLWIMPFQEVGVEQRIGRYGDPYAVKDYYSLDRSYGTMEELKTFIREAHKQEIRVIMDWVMNRGSVDHVWTKDHPTYFTQNENKEVYYEVPNRSYFAGLNFSNREMRKAVIQAMSYWISECDFDGFRLDDSDITPFDFLSEIRTELNKVKDDLVIISQSYDEYHHLESCDLTYDGNPRLLLNEMKEGRLTQRGFAQIYQSYTYSFPQGALRMSWLEEKELSRVGSYLRQMAMPAATILLTLKGIPMLMMGQEFNESTYQTWISLFEEYKLDWEHFDESMYEHYQFLIALRTNCEAFWQGDLRFIPNPEEKVLSYMRSSRDERYLVLVNLSEEDVGVAYLGESSSRIDLSLNKEVIYRTGKAQAAALNHKESLFIQAFETLIYKLV